MMKQLINTISINESRKALSIFPTLSEYIAGKVFENQVVAYTDELGWTVNEFVAHIIKINGLHKNSNTCLTVTEIEAKTDTLTHAEIVEFRNDLKAAGNKHYLLRSLYYDYVKQVHIDV